MRRLVGTLAVTLVVVALALVMGCGSSGPGTSPGPSVGTAGKPSAPAAYTIMRVGPVGGRATASAFDVSRPVSGGSPCVVGTLQPSPFPGYAWIIEALCGSLNPLGGNVSYGRGVSNAGDKAAGNSYTEDGVTRACLWPITGGIPGPAIPLSVEDASFQSEAEGINSSGTMVVGRAQFTSTGDFFHAAVWPSSGGSVTDLGILVPSSLPDPPAEDSAAAVNDSGWVVGMSGRTAWYGDPGAPNYHKAYSGRAFLWKNGAMEELLPLPGEDPYYSTGPSAINNRGQVVGKSGQHAAIWESGSRVATELGRPKPTTAVTWARDINENGQVVGELINEDAWSYKAAIWK